MHIEGYWKYRKDSSRDENCALLGYLFPKQNEVICFPLAIKFSIVLRPLAKGYFW
jgi:hypothetical protein